MVELLDAAEIQKRIHEKVNPPKQEERTYKYVKPFAKSYEGIIESMVNTDHRFTIGIAPIDTLIRGFGPKELIFVTGFSHAGKTQLVNTAILNNLGKRILFFSMDDPAEMILLKLTCMYADIAADELERLIRSGDEDAKATLKRAATDVFKNLIVVDDSLGIEEMDRAIAEATEVWGAPPDCVVIDYLELMRGNGVSDDANANVKSKSQALKGWVKSKDWPTIVLHQGTRSGAQPGKPLNMMSMAYGGEQEGTVVIGVRRKKDDRDADLWERQNNENTVTIHVIKNKRPPARVTKPDGMDLYMCPRTGLIRTARPSETGKLPTVERAETAVKTMAELERAVEEAERKARDAEHDE